MWNEGKSPPPFSQKLIAKKAVELGRIGVNLNQLIRAMNTSVASGQFIPNVEESLAVVQEVEKAVKELQFQLLGSHERQNSKR